ncbi:MAG: amino-acid racemase, partial [Lachnospiraceae bacterium]|nr:amino-acid racemase [Lachnospiraceae bacterium]
LVKNIRLYLIVTVIYIPISVYSGNMPHSIMELIKQLLFDGTFYHLWYFPAAIIGCILLACLTKKSMPAAIYFSLIAYVIGVFGDSYYGLIENVPLLRSLYTGIFYISSYTRNGIFFAPIYILLGTLLAVPEFHCREKVCRWGFVLSLLFMLFEGWITYSLNIQKHNSMYIFLLPVMYFLFQLLLGVSGKAPAWIRGGSMMLYIIHPAVIIVVRGIAKVTRLTKILVDNTFIQYISVCVLSLAAAFCIQVFLERGNRNVPKRKSMD